MTKFRHSLLFVFSVTLLACGGGGESGGVAPEVTSPAAAHRLLIQASFGPTAATLAEVQTKGIVAWVDEQLNMGSAYDTAADGWKTHLERTIEISLTAEPSTSWYGTAVFNEASADINADEYQMAAWWDNALGATAPGYEAIGSDQLRQRVAYALSQLLVTSDSAMPLDKRGEALAYYYDILARNAFGNYRTLLGEVSRSPTMGVYLSHMGNAKADPAQGTRPDENFAREVMQLFTIGLYRLNLDGSPDRDDNPASYPDAGNQLVPSYTQTDIEELSKVMTGWDLVANDFYGRLITKDGDYTQQMEFTASQHEDEVAEGGDGLVTVLGNTFALNAGSDGSGMDAALDILFFHPNVGPYVSKHLIQRLVTSNPSSAYITRVASVFNDNGNGIRGDLKAVVRAILLDPEARGDTYLTDTHFGKAKEPLLAITQLLRATHVQPLDGWLSQDVAAMNDVYWFPFPQQLLSQAPMRSPSVFNFYNPDFVPSDTTFATAGLVGPELQIQSDQTLVQYNNVVYTLLNTFEKNRIVTVGSNTLAAFAGSLDFYSNVIFLTDFDTELALFEQAMEGDNNRNFATIDDTATDSDGDTPKANGIDALLEHIDELLLGGTMSTEFRSGLKHYLLDGSGTNPADNFEEARRVIRDAYRLVATSSLYMIQK